MTKPVPLKVIKDSDFLAFLGLLQVARQNYVIGRVALQNSLALSGVFLSHQALESYIKAVLRLKHRKQEDHKLANLLATNVKAYPQFMEILKQDGTKEFLESLYVACEHMRYGEARYEINTAQSRTTTQKPIRFSLIATTCIGFGVFAYAELFNILFANTGRLQFLRLLYMDPQITPDAVVALALASACFGILRARKSVSEGLKSGIAFGGLCVIVAQLCLLLFDSKEMWTFVTMFSSGWLLFTFPILTNWFVLIVSTSLTLLVLLPRK